MGGGEFSVVEEQARRPPRRRRGTVSGDEHLAGLAERSHGLRATVASRIASPPIVAAIASTSSTAYAKYRRPPWPPGAASATTSHRLAA